MIYLQLFFEFFKAGLFAIGGGLATIPFLTDIGQRTGWFTSGELANMIAISESTPGPMGVNMATYVGFHTGGIAGGVIATLGLVCPSILVILVIAGFLKKFRESRGVDAVFYGIRPASTALIAAALAEVCSIALLNLSAFQTGGAAALFQWKGIALAVVIFVCLQVKPLKKLHPIVFIAASAVIGAVYNGVTGYFGDILSYSRLMVMMLAGSVIGQVFNILGAMPGGGLLRHFQHLPVQSEPGAELVQQDTQYPQPGIVITADALDRLLDLGNPQQAQDLRRHGDNQAVRSYICIYRQQTEGRRCINDDIVILIFYLGQGGFEQEFPSRPVKLQLRAGQQNVGRKDVAGICPYNGLLRLRLPPEYVINGGAMLNIQPQTEPQAPLRVHIHT